MNKSIKKDFLFINFISIILLILLFQSPLSLNINGVVGQVINSWDEIIMLVSLFVLFIHLISKKKINKQSVKSTGLFIIFILIGFIGTIIHNVQPISAVLEDIISCSKFFVTFYAILVCLDANKVELILKRLIFISKIITIILFLLTVVDVLMPGKLFHINTYRYGFHTVQLFFYHPAVLLYLCVALISILGCMDDSDKNKWYIIALLLIMLSTLRSKAFGFVIIYIFLYFYKKYFSNKKIARYLIIGLAIFSVATAVGESFQTYYGNDSTARNTLLNDSIKIANISKPFGYGYATYGSAAAIKHYSPLYIELGYLYRYGMGLGGGTFFLTDSFWPTIIAEFGYIGLLVFVLLLIRFSKFILNYAKSNKQLYLSAVPILLYEFICSTASTAFFNPYAVAFAILIGLYIKNEKRYAIK